MAHFDTARRLIAASIAFVKNHASIHMSPDETAEALWRVYMNSASVEEQVGNLEAACVQVRALLGKLACLQERASSVMLIDRIQCTLRRLGELEFDQDDQVAARICFRAELDIQRHQMRLENDEESALEFVLACLQSAGMEREAGELNVARARLHEALAVAAEWRGRCENDSMLYEQVGIHKNLGHLEQSVGRLDEATRQFQHAVDMLAEAHGALQSTITAEALATDLRHRAAIALATREHAEARGHYEAAVAAFSGLEIPMWDEQSLLAHSCAHRDVGEYEWNAGHSVAARVSFVTACTLARDLYRRVCIRSIRGIRDENDNQVRLPSLYPTVWPTRAYCHLIETLERLAALELESGDFDAADR